MTLHPAITAALFVLAGAAGGSGDYALILPGQPPICAVDEASCQNAMGSLPVPGTWYFPSAITVDLFTRQDICWVENIARR